MTDDSDWGDAPDYFLFLPGDPVPTWIERVEPPESPVRCTFVAPTEALRFTNHVEVRPLFPLTDEAPHLMWIDTPDGAPSDIPTVVHGAPTRIITTSRFFPDVLPPQPDRHEDGWNDDWDSDWDAPWRGE